MRRQHLRMPAPTARIPPSLGGRCGSRRTHRDRSEHYPCWASGRQGADLRGRSAEISDEPWDARRERRVEHRLHESEQHGEHQQPAQALAVFIGSRWRDSGQHTSRSSRLVSSAALVVSEDDASPCGAENNAGPTRRLAKLAALLARDDGPETADRPARFEAAAAGLGLALNAPTPGASEA